MSWLVVVDRVAFGGAGEVKNKGFLRLRGLLHHILDLIDLNHVNKTAFDQAPIRNLIAIR